MPDYRHWAFCHSGSRNDAIMDYLDRLYSQNQEFFDWIDFLMEGNALVEPDDEFMALSDANAESLLLEILNDKN